MEPQIKQMQSDWVKREETNYTDTILRLEKALEEKTRMHAKLAGIERRAEAKFLEAAKTSEACMAELAATSATAREASTLALVHLGESETKKFNIAIAAKQRMITARDAKIELLQGTVSTCNDEAQAVLTAHAALGLKLCRKIGSSGTDVQTSQPISKHIGGVGNAASNLLGALVKL